MYPSSIKYPASSIKYMDYTRIAYKIVNNCLRVKENDVIIVSGTLHNADETINPLCEINLIEEIALEIKKRGAFPVVELQLENLHRRLFNEIPTNILSKPPEYYIKWLESVDGIIDIGCGVNPDFISSIPKDKLSAYQLAGESITEKFQTSSDIRMVSVQFPLPWLAEKYNIPYEKLYNSFWNALDVDYNQLSVRGDTLAHFLQETKTVEIKSDNGTNLSLSIKGRKIHIEDGIVNNYRRRKADTIIRTVSATIPCGEVYSAPIETSVEGTAVFDSVIYNGEEIKNLTIKFSRGKINFFSAETGEDLFDEILSESEGAKDRVGEFGIGTNANLKEVIGYHQYDEKIGGTVHLALGNSVEGGENISDLHWDLVIKNPSVLIDGQLLIDKGKFVFEKEPNSNGEFRITYASP